MTENTITLNIDTNALLGGAVGGLIATSWNIVPLFAGANMTGTVMQFRPLLIIAGLVIGLSSLLAGARYIDGGITFAGETVATVLAAFLVFGGIGYAAAPAALSMSSGGTQQVSGDNLRVAALTVDGMVCQGCKLTVKNYLESMDGTKRVSVDLSKQQATVVYHADTLTADALADADVFTGSYSATVASDERYHG
jgi:copper chaperone CopZ